MENRYRQDLERNRNDYQKQVEESEQRHAGKRKQYEEEKSIVQEDKNTAIEEAKKKLAQLNKIDLENREMQYGKNLDNQRQLFEDQQSNLNKQL